MHGRLVDKYNVIDFKAMPTNKDFYEKFNEDSRMENFSMIPKE